MKTLVIAPHPDDETLGVGGTLLRRREEGSKTAWVIFTSVDDSFGWSSTQLRERNCQIESINTALGFNRVFELGYPAAKLDTIPIGQMVTSCHEVFREYEPDELFIPHQGDIHSDHFIVSKCCLSAAKTFRNSSIKRILAYETLSETEQSIGSGDTLFNPNVFINIESFIERKLEALSIYKSEISEFPFPRSLKAVRALAEYRGASSGFKAAEAFQLLRGREP